MKWAGEDQAVGFDVKDDPNKAKQQLVSDARQLFVTLGLFLGVVVVGFLMIRGGALREHVIKVSEIGTVMRVNPYWDARHIGSLTGKGMFYPTDFAKDGQSFKPAIALTEEEYKKRQKLIDKGKTVEPLKPPPERTVTGDWYQLRGEVRVAEGSRKGQLVEFTGWIPKSAEVEVLEGGFAGAFKRRESTFKTLWIIAGLCLLAGLFIPKLLVPIAKIWMDKVVHTMGYVNTRVLLTLVFYVAIAPVALFMRFIKKTDPLDRKLDKDQPTYWTEKSERDREHFHHTF